MSGKPTGPGDPTALTVDQMADLLTRAGKQKIEPAAIRADVEAGAPTNGDGTLHLVHYTAWLAGQAN